MDIKRVHELVWNNDHTYWDEKSCECKLFTRDDQRLPSLIESCVLKTAFPDVDFYTSVNE